MRKLFVVLALAGAFSTSAQMMSPMKPKPRGAPEPVTLVGLSVGAGVIGLGWWRSRKKDR